jgi:hypothetical protein
LGYYEQLEYEGFTDLGNNLRPIFKHPLWYLAEKVGLLAQNGPVFFTKPYELLMLDLVVLDGMVQLAL